VSARSWLKPLLAGCANPGMAACVAGLGVEIFDRELWTLLPVVAVPLALAYRVYAGHVSRMDEQHRRREVQGSLLHGMTAVDASGRIAAWDESAGRLLGCPPALAIGRTVVDAIPALARTTLPAAIQEVVNARTAKRFHVTVNGRTFDVRMLPVLGAPTLLCPDVAA